MIFSSSVAFCLTDNPLLDRTGGASPTTHPFGRHYAPAECLQADMTSSCSTDVEGTASRPSGDPWLLTSHVTADTNAEVRKGTAGGVDAGSNAALRAADHPSTQVEDRGVVEPSFLDVNKTATPRSSAISQFSSDSDDDGGGGGGDGSHGGANGGSGNDSGRTGGGSSGRSPHRPPTPPPVDAREKSHRHAANVARELASSEAAFVDTLKLIVEDFRGAIQKAREDRGDILVPDEVLKSILQYLPELLVFSSDLLDNLNARVERYETDRVIADVFVKIGQFLKLYSHYIKDYQARSNYLDEARKRYSEFNQIVQQFEASDRCQKLSVIQYMLKPVQRIPQYRLLLSDYLAHLDSDHPDRKNTETALDIVSKVADHANEAIKQGDTHAEMVRLQNSLITTRFNVFTPGRMLIKQGNLLKHNRKTPQSKRVVLFTDCLVYMTQVQSNLNTFKLNRELPLLGLTVKPDEVFETEFQVLSTSKSFTLIAQSGDERAEWIEAIRLAVDDLERKRRTFLKCERGASSSCESGNAGSGDDTPARAASSFAATDGGAGGSGGDVEWAPVWTPDSRVTMCRVCQVSFTTFRRRHHCRACGGVVCGPCSRREAWFSYNGGSYERVCDICAIKLPRERLKSTAGLPEMQVDATSSDSSQSNVLIDVPGGPGVNDEGSSISGYLKLFKRNSWKRYWYVLRERVLYVYKASADVAPTDQLVVLGFEVADADDVVAVKKFQADQQSLCFKLCHKGLEDMVLCADDLETAQKWKKRIREATQI